jgi:hypothetical protein
MVSVDCPRCGKIWYSDEDDEGATRLCSDCVDKLRRRHHGTPFRLDAFAFATMALLVLDVILIALAHLFPDVFGGFLILYGLILFVAGMFGLRFCHRGHWYLTDLDWDLARWPAMLALIGLACVLGFGSLVLPMR